MEIVGKVKVVTPAGEVVYVPLGGKVFVNGEEICDPTGIEIPIGCEEPESIESMIQRMVRQVSREVGVKDETLEESEDFDMDDDDDLMDFLTPAEHHALINARELREEEPVERESGKASKRAGDSSGREEDEYPDDTPDSGRARRSVRERDRERDNRGSERRDKEVVDRGEKRGGRSEADSEDAGEGEG